MPHRRLYLSLIPVLAFLAACSDSTSVPAGRRLTLSLTGAPALANGYHYEGWAIINGAPVSTGKFNVDAQDNIVTLAGGAIAGGQFTTGVDLRSASAIVITVEPAGDTDATPSGTKLLAGGLSGATATLSVAAPQALGNDFSSSTGHFILATPTTTTTTDELSGLWFIDASGASPAPGLSLPTLPSGWKYEGWAVVNGTPVSTGKFTTVSGADESAPYSGPGAGPPFPGEDLVANAPAGLTFPTNLSGMTAVITIEPSPDDSPMPFMMKPLVGTIPANAVDHTTYPMMNESASLPTGTASIR